MNREIQKVYDRAYLNAIKDFYIILKELSEKYESEILFHLIKNELYEMEKRYIGFSQAKCVT